MAPKEPTAGWALAASGVTDDPRAHHGLLERLRSVLSEPQYGCGSSEFNGPHAAEPNFHLRPAAIPSDQSRAGDSHSGDERPAAAGSLT
jgi:hypothetical protein